MKKPLTFAGVAAAYIVLIVSGMNLTKGFQGYTIFIPMAMLSLFVLSAAIMGYLFLSEPFKLYLDGHKDAAVKFFFQTVGFFAIFVALFLILAFFLRV